MPNGPMISPLRYPGGKSAIADKIARLISLNKPNQRSVYIEPFSGGSAVALYLAINDHVERSIINDLDRSIYAFWYSVFNHTDELCRLITEIDVNLENWESCKSVHQRKDETDLLELGFATFFLNRTNRSGIITAGPLGGKAQSSVTKLDCRFNKKPLIKRIEKIAAYRNRFEVYNLDVVDLINQVIRPLGEQAFVFYDPPYYHKADELYENHFKHEDHEHLRNQVTAFHHDWIMTYDNCPEIKEIYTNYNLNEILLNYSAAEKRKGKEVMIWPNNIIIQ